MRRNNTFKNLKKLPYKELFRGQRELYKDPEFRELLRTRGFFFK